MKTPFHLLLLGIVSVMASVENLAMAQTNRSNAEHWLAHSEIAPPFTVPASKSVWEKQRKRVRAQLWQLLGKLPPRPKVPRVQTLSREDRGDYTLEKFQFD